MFTHPFIPSQEGTNSAIRILRSEVVFHAQKRQHCLTERYVTDAVFEVRLAFGKGVSPEDVVSPRDVSVGEEDAEFVNPVSLDCGFRISDCGIPSELIIPDNL